MGKPPGLSRREVLVRATGALGALAIAPACGPVEDRCAGPAAPAQGLLSTVDHLLVLMMENRSFDHCFGALRLDPDYPGRLDVDGLTGNERNLDAAGVATAVFPQTAAQVASPAHSWEASHFQFDGGTNDGFVRAAAAFKGGTPGEVMGYYQRRDLPVSYALADQYTVCDRWFSSLLGPTWPNRFYLHAATSRGVTTNLPITSSNAATVWDHLAARCRTGKNYFAGSYAWFSGAFIGKSAAGGQPMTPVPIEELFRDAQAGTLPDFAVIDPDFGAVDDHPPRNLAAGQAFLATVVRALAESPQWPRLLLVVLYDEHGGFFDHVPPPAVPDSTPGFGQLGFRVPALAVGPMVRRGAVVHAQLEHCSLAATLAARFGIPSLGPRMDAAADLSAVIDPAQLAGAPPLPRPQLPAIELGNALEGATGWSSQPELDALAGSIPAQHRDLRPVEERLASWLRRGAELGAVRL